MVKVIETWTDSEGKERKGEREFTNRMHLTSTLKKARLSPISVDLLLTAGRAEFERDGIKTTLEIEVPQSEPSQDKQEHQWRQHGRAQG